MNFYKFDLVHILQAIVHKLLTALKPHANPDMNKACLSRDGCVKGQCYFLSILLADRCPCESLCSSCQP